MTFERISSQTAVATLLATEIYPRPIGFLSPTQDLHPRYSYSGAKRPQSRSSVLIFSNKRLSRDPFQVLSIKAWVARLPTLLEEDTSKMARTDEITSHPMPSHHPITKPVSIYPPSRLVDQFHYSPTIFLSPGRPRFQNLKILLDAQSRHSPLSNQTWLNTLGPRLSTIEEE
ncbi:hypothetical protein PHYBLDRAFT_144698 [Phycomyces blakesleeanus NRRL 1555(-)]|uniref:Uncharacterized protein n=1 Tax=Phycomyces blakesleeanus (strain ATCC 8743b / DSM 1359 / FGSC 10004 / NBRC 33097 / NRRL 1555) TaxID=763407 RepID=A0A163DYS0_PHYB8|nr:hypothetical protein PHYBLDRAFT_144698 [Phycomyces blakesleeanus NRRL 1555(-)]OAD74250.1 hypothetical protein PHYBLDRAFT_144698 [Phycomyces blakesleeanus NRRL 1555(-)]|eukprot:XP_018292290.1 hypothetical protein PHYBLDRAFT_144698 [Phycomyces blakesleeanus NRRL 1555(-)]